MSVFRIHATTDDERSTGNFLDARMTRHQHPAAAAAAAAEHQHPTDGRLESLRYRSGPVDAEQDKPTRMRGLGHLLKSTSRLLAIRGEVSVA